MSRFLKYDNSMKSYFGAISDLIFVLHLQKNKCVMTPRILVVDDEETLCEVLKLNLENEGYDVDVAYSAEQALQLNLTQYSLILLDIMMGEISGIKMAKIMKSKHETADIPIIFCTAKDTEDDMINGLNIGADDYIMKPYTIRNILARVKTVLRRTSHSSVDKQDVVVVQGLSVDLNLKVCKIDGKEIKLSKKEFEILAFLMKNQNRIFTRDELLNFVWKDEVIVLDRTVDVNIRRLRMKLSEYGSCIITRSGYGYGFQV